MTKPPQPPFPDGPEDPLHRQDWSDAMGRRWLDHIAAFEGMLAPLGKALVRHAKLSPGETVVDVGCGGGPTSLAIADQVSPGGFVLGLDVSTVLVDAATRRASKARRRPGSAPVRFVVGDAASAEPADAPFDVLFSRFGVMFFDDPYAAFAHMRGWLKPGGRLVFSCWTPPTENPWMLEIQDIIARYVTPPEPEPHAPGPFALADPDRTRDILESAGFEDVALEVWHGEQPLGGPGASPAEAVDFATNGMHVGQMLEDEPDDVKARARADLIALFEKHHRPDGVMLPSSAWFVTAQAPADIAPEDAEDAEDA